MIQTYINRRMVEEGYRFSKQGLDLEKVQARKLATLQNLAALATLARGLLARDQNEAQRLITSARRYEH